MTRTPWETARKMMGSLVPNNSSAVSACGGLGGEKGGGPNSISSNGRLFSVLFVPSANEFSLSFGWLLLLLSWCADDDAAAAARKQHPQIATIHAA